MASNLATLSDLNDMVCFLHRNLNSELLKVRH